tara:strand:- start:1416 stop:1868 length:453 start_codon:yes stop_codon:yes gene_type:complete
MFLEKDKKVENIFKIVLLIVLLTTNGLYGNYAFKKKVKSVCASYRIDVDVASFDFDETFFSMSLESGRNNFEMFMIVGFAASGQAVSHQQELGLSNAYMPENIQVTVNVPSSKGEVNTFVATCSSKTAIKLADGEIDSSEFMQIITLKII